MESIHVRQRGSQLKRGSTSQAYVVYTELIEPTLERRRERQELEDELEWDSQETERATQLSILEHQHEQQRRADRERWEQAHVYSNTADSTLRRRRPADVSARSLCFVNAFLMWRFINEHQQPFSDEHVMQEVSSPRSNAGLLFDAGPSSRLDKIHIDTDTSTERYMDDNNNDKDNEDAELLETAKSLSLEYTDEPAVSEDALLNSPRSSLAGSNLDTYSVIEPDTRPGSSFTSRSQSPLIIVDASTSSIVSVSSPFHTPLATSQQDLTAASLERMEAENSPNHNDRGLVSPTPTVRSLTGTMEAIPPSRQDSVVSPSYIASSRAPSQAGFSRPISPFSELGFASAHSSDDDVDYVSSRPNATIHGARESDKESQWSDLGEDSSDEEVIVPKAVGLDEREQQHLRERRQRFFAGTSSMTI